MHLSNPNHENDQSVNRKRHTASAENFGNILVVVTGFGRPSDAVRMFFFMKDSDKISDKKTSLMDANKEKDITDKEIVDGILRHDPEIIEYFFIKKCSKLFVYLVNSIFNGRVEKEELINELFLYIANSDWKKLREFNYQSSLLTWVTVVATRFFIKKRELLIENDSSETLIRESLAISEIFISVDTINLKMAIDIMPNERYRRVIQMLDLQDLPYEEVATMLDVSVANLYNIHRRAIAQLRCILIT